MEEIDLKELFFYYVKRIPIIVFITLLIFVIGICYSLLGKTDMYSSDTTIILVSGNNDEDEVTQTNISINEKLVTTYSQIIKSRKVLSRVKDELKLKYSINEIASKITVTGVDETEIIKISVKSNNSKEAKNIANAVAKVFEEEVQDIYNLENVAILDKALESTSPYNRTIVKDSAIYILVGIVFSTLIIFVIFYFDNSVKSQEEVEAKLGIPVIGQVPLYEIETSKKNRKKGK